MLEQDYEAGTVLAAQLHGLGVLGDFRGFRV